MRARVLVLCLLLAGCDTSHVSEGIGPFKAPGAQAREAAAAARDPATAIDIYAPRLTRDGKAVIVAFRYGPYNSKLAILPTDPADKRANIILLPPMMAWFDPSWAPDEKGFVAASYCEGDNCYEGAQGYNIWRAWLRPTDNLKRLTTDSPLIQRHYPFFGKDENDLYWVIAEKFVPSEHVHRDVSPRFLVHQDNGAEQILYPARDTSGKYKAGSYWTTGLWVRDLRPAGLSADGSIYFAGDPSTIFSNEKDPLRAPIRNLQGKGGLGAVFRYQNGTAVLASPLHTDDVAGSSTSADVIFVRHPFVKEHPGAVSDFTLMHGGVETPLFRFDSFVTGVAASADLDTIVFAGTRGLYGQSSLWVWRKGDAAPVDLNAPERVKEQCDREIAAEKAAAAPRP